MSMRRDVKKKTELKYFTVFQESAKKKKRKKEIGYSIGNGLSFRFRFCSSMS